MDTFRPGADVADRICSDESISTLWANRRNPSLRTRTLPSATARPVSSSKTTLSASR